MSSTYGNDSAAVRYNRALGRARQKHLPAGYRSPQPTSVWPEENVELLERYRLWLLNGGTSPAVNTIIHLPTAGHVLGLALKPHSQLDLEADFASVLDYVRAKGLSESWIDNTGHSLEKFRQFMRHERGQSLVTVRVDPGDLRFERYCQGLPDWLAAELRTYQRLRQSRWRPARLATQSRQFWDTHTAVWRWVAARQPGFSLAEVKRSSLVAFADTQLERGLAVSTINTLLRSFHAFLLFLQEQEYTVPRSLLRLPTLKMPDRLPRFLTDEQMRLVRAEVGRQVSEARFAVMKRDALLVRAAFYLLWQSGLRLGEVEELRLEDLDFIGRKVMVRQGKGQKDRAAYLTDTTVAAIEAYLPVRGLGASEHVFLYRHVGVQKDLIRCRLKALGERVGVKVTPHQLRHTCATQLLNAGCRVTSIQKLLGHRRLDTTLVYARVHDQTVSADYYAAMTRIEARLDPATSPSAELPASPAEANDPVAIHPFTRAALLGLANRLADPKLAQAARLALAEQLQSVLNGKVPKFMAL
jgi:site-specific recombinase XerD